MHTPDPSPPRASARNFLRLVKQFVKPYWPWLVLSTILTFLSTATTLPLPLIIKYLIDDVIINQQAGALLRVFLMVLGVMLATRAVMLAMDYVIAFIGQRVKFHIRHALVEHLHRLSMGYYDRIQTGKLMSRIISDGYAIQSMLSSGMMNIFTDFFTLIVIILVLFMIHWKLALITVVVLPCYAVTHKAFAGKMQRTSKLVRRKTDDVMANLEECISGVRVVKSFVKEQYEANQFKKEIDEHFRLNMRQNVLGTVWNAIAAFISGVGAALVLWYGGTLIQNEELTLGTLLAFYAYTAFVYGPIVNLISVNVTVQRANAAIERLFETLDTAPQIQDAPDAVALSREGGPIRFDGVTFGYDHQPPVLQNIGFDVQAGMKVGIVGPSGSGKSTLVKLIPRLYDVTAGVVSIDGHDVRHIQLQSLRHRIGMVPQDSTLFSGTIGDNIRYGRPEASDDEVIDVAKAANIHHFIMTLEKGYKTMIGEQGIKLSGGQQQRIAIARALLTDPAILILDDCTSALDSKTEALIQEALHERMKNRTSFIIAHRLSSVVHCDRIFVLVNGRIKARGTHEELLERSSLYRRMYTQQFRETEETVV